jgi:hypothetical protein
MITTSEAPRTGNFVVRIALVASLFVHAFVLLVALLATAQFAHAVPRPAATPPQPDEIVTISSAPRSGRRPTPEDRRLAFVRWPPQVQNHARPRVSDAAIAIFRRAAARFAQPDSPLTISPDPAQAPQRYRIQLQGVLGHLRHGEGIYYPIKGWRSGDLDYYYVAYQFTYPDGTLESGNVPWPIHFEPGADPFISADATVLRHTPMPGPPPGFVPPGDLGKALRAYFPNLHFEDDAP